MLRSDDMQRRAVQCTPAQAGALLEACEAALAWVDAAAADDGTVDLERDYWAWVERMRAALTRLGPMAAMALSILALV